MTTNATRQIEMSAESFPTDAIAAATHRDPYPYYAHLVAHDPIFRDESLGLWIATSAEAVTAALGSDICRVRPVKEPIPAALIGSPAAEIFGRLIRMNDGGGHCPFNRAVAATLGSLDAAEIAKRSAEAAHMLADRLGAPAGGAGLTDYMFQMSVQVLGRSLGLPDDALAQTGRWIAQFVRSVFPGSTPPQIEDGKVAAGKLLEQFRALLQESRARGGDTLLTRLAREAEHVGRADVDVILANAIGFLSQAYEATAGLIGNSLLALAAHSEARARILAARPLLGELILEVLRHDPPTHNTRRFLAADATVAGQPMKAGESILVVVAAANRDPAANAAPERFDFFRTDRRVYTFGVGAHACPGERYAVAIAQAAVARLLDADIDTDALAGRFSYRPSANTRVPLFI